MKLSLSLLTVLFTLSVNSAIAVEPVVQTSLDQSFTPTQKSAQQTVNAASKDFCLSGKPFTSLAPANAVGLTIAKHPTFFWYMPKSSAKSARFMMLGKEDSEVVYETEFALPSRPGIVRFQMPKSAPALETGKLYHWYVVVNCDNYNQSANPSIEGWIKPTLMDKTLAKTLAQANLQNQFALYVEHDIWHETLTTLADLRSAYPGNPQFIADWQNVLETAGFRDLATEPIVNCCSVDRFSAGLE
jgi:hypothetical protein